MNSNQFLSILEKGNDLQKEDFQQLVKLHGSFPYFQIPAVLAAKYELQNGKQESSELLHTAAILSPNRSRLKYLIEEQIEFFDNNGNKETFVKTLEPTATEETTNNAEEGPSEITAAEKPKAFTSEETPQLGDKDQTTLISDLEKTETDSEDDLSNTLLNEAKGEKLEEDRASITTKEPTDIKDNSEDIKASAPLSEENKKEEERSNMVSSSHPTDEEKARPDLITTPYGGDEATRPGLLLPDSGDADKTDSTGDKDTEEAKTAQKEEKKPIIEPIPGPPSSRQQILKQLEDNLAKLKSDSGKNKTEEKPAEEPKRTIVRRKRSGDDLIDSIKKKEKREIKDTKKKEQNDIIKAFNKKSIKLAAIRENEDVNKLQDLSLSSTKINDRMVSESYAKLLTQQGKKAAAKEIYKRLILKFPQKKAYFADLIQQLEV